MKGIILAAGRGSRMGAVTDAQPKCLTILAGKTLFEWQKRSLIAAGMQQIAVVTGYQAEKLQNSSDTVFHNPRWAETNMVMSLMTGDAWLKANTCIVSYADIVCHPNIIKQLYQADGDLVITYDLLWQSLWTKRFRDALSDAETFMVDNQGKLLNIGQRAKSLDEIQGQYMGLLKFSPRSWEKVTDLLKDLPPTERDQMDMTSLLNKLLSHGMSIHTVAIEGRWCEVDSVDDLTLYESILQQQDSWKHDWRF